MIRRFYVHNFRCLENFELALADLHSVLLIGKNGSGKSSVFRALWVLQQIARGELGLGELIAVDDLTRGRMDTPVRIEIQADLHGRIFDYSISLAIADRESRLRVREERLAVNGDPIFARRDETVRFGAEFPLRTDATALWVLQSNAAAASVFAFAEWLSRMIILSPIPRLMMGASDRETLRPLTRGEDLGEWFSGVLAHYPRAYTRMDDYLRQVMPDFKEIRNPTTGKGARSLEITFINGRSDFTIPFHSLSDGEKCFVLASVVLAANESYGPLVCIWDEPDGHLSADEVSHFVMALRKSFRAGGQFLCSSHNAEVVRSFANENTLLLHRMSHWEPTVVRPLAELEVHGSLADALIRGDVAP